ncbi:hypothetical protein Droror1_Dr00012027, partial [Drosera rotundifolia]
QKQPNVGQKQPYIGQKQPNVGQKQPYIGQKQPNVGQKQPYIGQKSPYISKKSPYISKKSPYISKKSPYIVKKRKKGKRPFRIRCPQIKSGDQISYRNVRLINKFLSRKTAEIFPRRITKLTFKQQRLLSSAIKQARILSLLPFFKYPEKRFTKDQKRFKKDTKRFKKYKKRKIQKT